MSNKYQTLGLETPEWLLDSQTAIDKAAESRVRDQMEKELRETEARMEALKSADEKRSELKEKQARLKAKLGRT
jgi:spore cortex formation protein SpoVR/YcgB (stage V sporulation)